MTRDQALEMRRGDLVLDLETGELLLFMWPAPGAFEPMQLVPALDRSDFSRTLRLSEAVGSRYVRL